MPKVSVVIPTYNCGRFISQSVESVLNQTFKDCEVIVVDDGSTDDTLQRLERHIDKIRYIYQTNQERSVARNTGIAASQGQYIAFLDADDWWHPQKLEAQLEIFNQNSQLGLVYSWVRQVGPNGELLRLMKGTLHNVPAKGAWVFDDLIMGGLPGPGSSILVSRDCCDEIGGFRADLRYSEDQEFCLRAAHRYQVGCVAHAHVFYRARGTYLPGILRKLDMPNALVTIARDTLFLAGIEPDSYLARKVMGKALCQGSLADFGAGDFTSANERLGQLLTLNTDLLSGNPPPFLTSAAYFANSLYDTITPVEDAEKYMRNLFEHLTAPLRSLRTHERRTLGLVCAINAFDNASLGYRQEARRSAFRAALHDPIWLKNIGLVKMAIESTLPTVISSSWRN